MKCRRILLTDEFVSNYLKALFPSSADDINKIVRAISGGRPQIGEAQIC